jgi:hypothetical protein
MHMPRLRSTAAWGVLSCVLLGWGSLGLGAGAASAATLIAQTSQPTPVSAYDGVIAWSAFSDGAYRLVVSAVGAVTSAAGAVTPVPTPSEPQPFDASVGPNQRGEGVVLFSRCASYRGGQSQLPLSAAGGRCRVYAYDLTHHTVAPLDLGGPAADSLTHPSEWGSRVAVVVSTPRGSERIEVVSLTSHRHSTLPPSTLAHGSVDSLRLVGSRVVSSWYAAGGLDTEVVQDTLSGSRELLAEGTQEMHSTTQLPNPTGVEFFGASLTGGEAYWVEPGDGLIGTPSTLSFYNFFTHTSTTEEASPNLFSAALDGGRLFLSTGTASGGCPCEIIEQ